MCFHLSWMAAWSSIAWFSAYHEDRYLPEYAFDFIEITKEVFDRLSRVRPVP